MPLPGFVRLGVLAVSLQLLVVAGLYGYLRCRHPVTDPGTRQRSSRLLIAGLGYLGILAGFVVRGR